jgi:hypothetical protein
MKRVSAIFFRLFSGAFAVASFGLLFQGLYAWDYRAAFGVVAIMTSGLLNVAAYLGDETQTAEFGDWAEELRSGVSNVSRAS